MAKILVVDDEKSIRSALRQVLEYDGHTVHLCPDGPSGLEGYAEFGPDVTLLDVKMPRMDGLETLERIRKDDPAAVVIMISGHGTISTAVEATRKGAFDFLEKPLKTARLELTLRNALMVRGLAESVERLKQDVEVRYEIVGGSDAIRAVLRRIEKVGGTLARVLVTGENGTGKELVARALHRLSSRAEKPFVDVNCAAIPANLIESELFGHVRGAFTGAVASRPGKFELAHGGTLFLDEVGDMSLAAQAKVLKALEGGAVTRVGGTRPVPVDVRVLSATNKDLEAEIAEGSFREDLYYRLNVVPIRMPPLRARRDDVPMLVAHFVDHLSRTTGVPRKPFSPAAVAELERQEWPGNVRELKNTVERLLILSAGEAVELADVLQVGSGDGGAGEFPDSFASINTFSEFKDATEKVFLAEKLRATGWNVSETAASLGMVRTTLYRKIRKHGLLRAPEAGEASETGDAPETGEAPAADEAPATGEALGSDDAPEAGGVPTLDLDKAPEFDAAPTLDKAPELDAP